MLKTLVKYTSIIILIASLIAILSVSTQPEQCALCEQESYHAPCVLNLSTGEVLELAVYDEYQIQAGRIKEQEGGFFTFLRGAGLIGYRDTANWMAQVSLPERTDIKKLMLFCKDCRHQLKKYGREDFILADFYTVGAPVLFMIQDGAEYKVRCYQILVNETDKFTITVYGRMQNG